MFKGRLVVGRGGSVVGGDGVGNGCFGVVRQFHWRVGAVAQGGAQGMEW